MGALGDATTDAIPPVIAVAALAPGAVVADRYRLEARLGAGGGGTVWRCRDEQLGATVALKIVAADGDLERWRREVAMARRIANRNVCRVHDLGEAGELRYVTMELVEGESLRRRIAGMSAAAARDVFTQVVAGAAAIHAAGVVHRDLKPENVVVAHDGRAVIVDFGLAREPAAGGAGAVGGAALGEAAVGAAAIGAVASTVELRGPVVPPAGAALVTHAGVVVGTPRYMSPEQAAGAVVDARTDVWALGLIGHELLTGALPATGPAGRQIDPALDGAWPGSARLVRRCLAQVPAHRFADARELERALAGLGRRRRAGRVALAAAVMAVLGGGVVALRAAMRTRSPPDRPAPLRWHALTTTDTKRWPVDTPISVALAPDAARYAYTTGDGRLLVRSLPDGAPVAWTTPVLDKPRSRDERAEPSLATLWAVGWFSDGAIALVGSRRDGSAELDRVYPDGRTQRLYRSARRFTAAVTAAGDRAAIAIDAQAVMLVASVASGSSTASGPADSSAASGPAGSAGPDGVESTPVTIATLGPGDRIMAIAWSPDGRRLAWARRTADRDDAAIEVRDVGDVRDARPAGAAAEVVWRGPLSEAAGTLLAWLDDDRLAVGGRDAAGHARLLTVEVRGRAVALRADWPDGELGVGSAVRGTLLVLRGQTSTSVQVGDHAVFHVERLHPRGQRGGELAGWTADGRVVFAAGEPGQQQVVRAGPGQPLERWPGTRDGVDVPDTLAGDDILVHRRDPAAHQVVVELITPAGARSELVRIPDTAAPATGVVRCADDRAAPCVLEELDAGTARWTLIDPATGARGAALHRRPLRDRVVPSAALSSDGRLAIVDGGETLTLIDRAGATATRSAGDGVALHAVGFAPDGDAWLAATGFHGRLFGLLTFDQLTSGRISSSPSSQGSVRGDALRRFSQPRPSPDGKQIAVETLELALDLWRVDDL